MWHNMKNMFASNIIHTADNSIHINVQSCARGAVDVMYSLFLQAHRPSKQHLQEAFKEPLAALVDV